MLTCELKSDRDHRENADQISESEDQVMKRAARTARREVCWFGAAWLVVVSCGSCGDPTPMTQPSPPPSPTPAPEIVAGTYSFTLTASPSCDLTPSERRSGIGVVEFGVVSMTQNGDVIESHLSTTPPCPCQTAEIAGNVRGQTILLTKASLSWSSGRFNLWWDITGTGLASIAWPHWLRPGDVRTIEGTISGTYRNGDFFLVRRPIECTAPDHHFVLVQTK